MSKKVKLKIRQMHRGDLNHVLEIECRSFEQPYSREIFEQELKIKVANLWVVTCGKQIVGYIDFWLVQDEMELISIAVHPRHKRVGIGEMLMHEMIRYAHQSSVAFIYLDVRVSNQAAQRLYGKFGFKRVGVRKRYYSDNREDAIIMKKELR